METWARAALDDLERRGLRRGLEPFTRGQGTEVEVDGRRLVNFASNDYLGLALDGTLAEAAAHAARELGAGSGASRLVVGDSPLHRAVEEATADLLGAPAGILFGSGYAANTGLLPVVAGEGDVIVSDALNHASIVDGCRLSRARTLVVPHGDVDTLDQRLATADARRKIVVTETVFSMDGDVAPLADVAAVCARHGALLVLDEAHAFGVFGPRGAGVAAALGELPCDTVRVVTLGKAVGAHGAVVVGGAATVALLKNRARTFVYATAPPPAVCAAALAGLRRLATADDARARLWRNIDALGEGLRALGIRVRSESPIVPVVLGAPDRAMAAMDALRAAGVLVRAMRPPTVPEGTSRLRFTLSASHTLEHVDLALAALRALPGLA